MKEIKNAIEIFDSNNDRINSLQNNNYQVKTPIGGGTDNEASDYSSINVASGGYKLHKSVKAAN